jgi:CRISPR/Cas system-associated exonuclease Cas4 (RecB family)
MSEPPDLNSRPALFDKPHLSHSRINRYLTCPEQYRLYYLENLRPRLTSANLVFGRAIHAALAQFFAGTADAVTWFMQEWDAVLNLTLNYPHRDSWETLRSKGHILLSRFLREELPRIGQVHASEQPFDLQLPEMDLPFVGVIDLIAEVDHRRTVVDFKTSASSYPSHEVQLSDQLSAYQLAEPEAEQRALWVFVKTRDPRIEWQVTPRRNEQVMEYLAKAQLVAREIAAGHFYKRPGSWCAWCDFLSVCLGDQRKAEETLVQINPANE